MATATNTVNKQRQISHLMATLGKKAKAEAEERALLEQFLYAICREGVTRTAADLAYASLIEHFFDWNEVRVSSQREIADVLEPHVADAEARAQRIVELLQEVFESTFSFDLDTLIKKGSKQAGKQLFRYKAANDYAVAWVVQNNLDGNVLPLDMPSLRALQRLGLVDEMDAEAARGAIETHIPKGKISLFVDIVSALADEHCWEADPNCPRCPMASACPIGQDAKSTMATTASKKPR